MSKDDTSEKNERAKELLNSVRHAAMATVNEDGSPHNTPYFFMKDDELKHLYWSSHPESQHSQNVNRTGQVFVVLYEANKGGGLYLRTDRGRIAEGSELNKALKIMNTYRTKAGKEPQSITDFSGQATQRLYIADIQQLWVNGSAKDEHGNIQKDQRYEITSKDLI